MTAGEDCPFCRFAAGADSAFNTRNDIVWQDDDVMAFISPRWWPNNPGAVIVIPRRHFADLSALPDALLFPRWLGDRLYQNADAHRFAASDERRPYAELLEARLAAGIDRR